MDWIPPHRKLNDRYTIWPHDIRNGWSYCVKIPSWTLLSKSRYSDPVMFYRVQVCLQSPESVTTMRRTLRRFNDFLKLLADLKRAFPKKSFPSAPPKGILRVKSREMLEERRCSLEDWVTKLLTDIELSRSVVVASFLELEATARSACQGIASDSNDDGNITSLSSLVHTNLSFLHSGGSSLPSSDYGRDTAYETSELGSASLGQDDVSETGTEDLDEDLTNPTEKLVNSSMSNIDEGFSMSQNILEQLEDLPKHIIETDLYNGKALKGVFRANNTLRLISESETNHSVMHDRKLSAESVDGLPLLASDTSTSGILSSIADRQLDCNLEMQGSGQIVLPLNMQMKLNRIILTMNERLVNSKTDMDDLIARLNQETAVKEYLNRKVDDLEVELETTIQRNKENLEHALTTERD